MQLEGDPKLKFSAVLRVLFPLRLRNSLFMMLGSLQLGIVVYLLAAQTGSNPAQHGLLSASEQRLFGGWQQAIDSDGTQYHPFGGTEQHLTVSDSG
eukprot:19110-Heterococcus_DN1.PRE.1